MKISTTYSFSQFSIGFSVVLMSLLLTIIFSSCEQEDDIPPVSAWVKPPEPAATRENLTLNFESSNPEFEGFGEKDGAITASIVDNPVSGGINTSSKVGKVVQTSGIEPWAGFSFVLSEKIDFSTNRTIKLKVYSPTVGETVLVKLEDKSNSDIKKEIKGTTTVENTWEELSFVFAEEDKDKFDRLVLFFDFNGDKTAKTTHYFDDIIQVAGDGDNTGGEGGGMPTDVAPTPTVAEADVISIFSDAYAYTDNLAQTDFFPDWGQATVATEVEIQGNKTLEYKNFDYQGITFKEAAGIDVSGMTTLHVDYWSTNSTKLDVYLINPGPIETSYAVTLGTAGQWHSVDIPLSSYTLGDTKVDLTKVFQMKIVGDGTIYIDNIYFYKQ